MTTNDLERLKQGGFSDFLAISDCAHISTANYDEMAGDRLAQNSCEFF